MIGERLPPLLAKMANFRILLLLVRIPCLSWIVSQAQAQRTTSRLQFEGVRVAYGPRPDHGRDADAGPDADYTRRTSMNVERNEAQATAHSHRESESLCSSFLHSRTGLKMKYN